MIYYDILTWGVKIIQIEACDNYVIVFNTST
jgi:hypothetical protein